MALDAAEQYMLELINRARLDPLGEAARHGIDLNQSLSPGQLHGAPRGVLAAEASLELAAIGHSQWMLATDIFSHTGVNNTSPAQRAEAAGYTGWGAGENISWRGTTGALNLETVIGQQHSDLFLSAGHRVNILYDSYREIGIAQEAGQFRYNGTTYNASMLTQNFSTHGDTFYVTGVVYDDLNGDRFYSIGEGRGGARFTTPGDTALSASAGGYALQAVEGGMVLVSGSVEGRGFSARVLVEGVNAKLDVVNGDMFHASADLTLVSGIHDARLLGTGAIDATGNKRANLLTGNAADNLLSGLGAKDRLMGGAGDDRLTGGAGRDVLAGETGDDRLTGGGGADSFVFGFAAGQDVIADFSAQDVLRLDRGLWGGQAANAAQVVADHAAVVGGDVVLDLGQGHAVTLTGVGSLVGLADQIVLF